MIGRVPEAQGTSGSSSAKPEIELAEAVRIARVAEAVHSWQGSQRFGLAWTMLPILVQHLPGDRELMGLRPVQMAGRLGLTLTGTGRSADVIATRAGRSSPSGAVARASRASRSWSMAIVAQVAQAWCERDGDLRDLHSDLQSGNYDMCITSVWHRSLAFAPDSPRGRLPSRDEPAGR